MKKGRFTIKKTNEYISNRHLYGLVIHYKNEVAEAIRNDQEPPRIPEAIGGSIMLICTNLTKKGNFSAYSLQYKQEMVSDAIVDCISAIANFDPDKTNNPFAYFTSIAWNAFIRRIQKEKKQQYIKLKNYEQTFVNTEGQEHLDAAQHKFNEITSTVIKNYEEKYLVKSPPEPKAKPKKLRGLDKLLVNDD